MEKKVRHRLPGEKVFVLLLCGVSLFLLWASYGVSGFQSLTSAGMFPMFASAVMVACMGIVLVQTWRNQAEAPQDGESSSGHFMRRVAPKVILQAAVVIAVYMALMEQLGFLVSSYLFLVAGMQVLGSKRIGLNLVVSALVLAAIYVVFQTAFSVILPEGLVWQHVFK